MNKTEAEIFGEHTKKINIRDRQIIRKVEVMSPMKGDVLFFTVKSDATTSERQKLMQAFDSLFPDQKVLILENGMDVGIVRSFDIHDLAERVKSLNEIES